MAIVFGGDSGIREDSFSGLVKGLNTKITEFSNDIKGIQNNLLGRGSAIIAPKENVYVDDGFQNVPGTVFTGSANIGNIDDVQKRRITTQTPDITVYVKKRVFWSLRNEHDSKLMGAAEKLFLRASKALFERKCTQIAAYEAMTKLEKFNAEEVELDVSRIEGLIAIVQGIKDNKDALEQLLVTDLNAGLRQETNQQAVTNLINVFAQEFDNLSVLGTKIENIETTIKGLEDLKQDARLTTNAIHTTWVVDTRNNTNRENLGRGTGVIELTLVDSVQTNLSLESGNKGSFSFNIQDPYNLLTIRREDIELAIGTAAIEAQLSREGITIDQGPQQILEEARALESTLKKARNSRFGLLGSGGSALSGADNSEIIFEINPSAMANNKVTGRISSITEPFTRDTYNFVFLQLPAQQQLTSEEQQLVKEIFDKLHEYVDAVAGISISSSNVSPSDKDNADYARRQMRMHYLGKPIVQPMDGIHIYLRSNTFDDAEVIGPLSYLLNDTPFLKGFSGGKSVEGMTDVMLQEEMRQFNISDKISIDLYKSIRSSSLLRNAGIHIFGGLVSTVGESYNASRGTYTLSVNGESNMKWLDMSRVNVTPSLDQAQGVLEDPITPLDIKVSDATGLIDGAPISAENQKRIDQGILFYKDGVRLGEKVTDVNIKQGAKDYGETAQIVRKHAPGLVYKWKQGIIVATRNVNLRTSLSGASPAANTLRRDVGVNVVSNAFANLDVADVISLLVTGQPHNYESFLKNASSIGTYVAGQGNNPESFFNSVSDITRSTNRALGGFEALKFLNISREQMAKRLSKQTELSNQNKDLQKLQQNIARFQDDINLIKSEENQSTANESLTKLEKLTKELRTKRSKFQDSIKDSEELGYRIYGNDVLFEGTDDSDEVQRQNTKNLISSRFLQMRPQLSTKLNADTNLFVVSDDYDKDLDLQAFTTQLASGEVPIWNSTYKSPKEICINAADVIDFEFFCDTQGNLRLQPPKYNKLPLSLLAKMLLLKDKGDRTIDIMPPFVRNLFESRKQGLDNNIEIYKKEIEILSLLLYGTKEAAGDNIDLKNQGDAATLFLSKGTIIQSARDGVKKQLEKLDSALGRVNEILELKKDIANLRGTQVKESLKPNIEKDIKSLNDPNAPNVNSRRLSKINRLLHFNSQLQRAQSQAAKIEERQGELETTLKNVDSGFGTPLTPGNLQSFLEPFGDLIEDDFNDFLGPGSSKRFIIRDDKMISYDFRESDQNVSCRVDVTGQVDLVGEGPGEIGGVPMIWAGATDFDIWKQYGYRPGPTTTKPFFKNAEAQCAPYALMLLTRQRKDTVRASITLVGNEYYQLGDVVYINSRDMLYYVTSVSHSFSYSGSFTTKLDLRYGHPLGEFIPTPLDVVGKNLIRNNREFNTTFVHRTTSSPIFGRSTGVIIFRDAADPNKTVEKTKISMLQGDIGFGNLTELKNALLRINAHIDTPRFDKVEVRGFIKEGDEKVILTRMAAVREWLIRPIGGVSADGNEIPLDPVFKKVPEGKIKDFADGEDPVLLDVDENTGLLKEENIGRTPSEEVYNVLVDPRNEFQNVVEIVIVFKEE